MTVTTEFDLIERIRARVSDCPSVPVGIGDDAAVLLPDDGRALVASTDSLVPDRHFLHSWSSEVIGHLALAVNLSDLAAMAARPRWALLALTLPDSNTRWLDGFLDGFLRLAAQHELILVGGNLARGPLNIGVQVLGDVSIDAVGLRSGSQPDDLIAVTGTLGDAAAALRFGSLAEDALHQRWQRPDPRVAAGQILGSASHSMMDISDGLLADLDKLMRASNCGARLDLERLPASEALCRCLPDSCRRQRLQAEGGSDYELLVTLGPESLPDLQAELLSIGETLTVIGQITDTGILDLRDADGTTVELNRNGWDHFQR